MATSAMTLRANARKTMNEFKWGNLGTSDPAAAAKFYGQILGWTYDEMPIGEGMVHRDAQIGGLSLAGIDPLAPGSDMPTAWTCFVYVEDLNARLTDAKRLGGTVVME